MKPWSLAIICVSFAVGIPVCIYPFTESAGGGPGASMFAFWFGVPCGLSVMIGGITQASCKARRYSIALCSLLVAYGLIVLLLVASIGPGAGTLNPLAYVLFLAPPLVTVAIIISSTFIALIGKKEMAEPGATDNPDDAQRLREDH